MCEAGEYGAAATAVLDLYGSAIYSFIAGLLRQPSRADDVFSDFSEHLWRGLPTFEWRCSIRAWVFTLARNATLSHLRREDHRRKRNLSLSKAEHIAYKLRTDTAPHLKTEQKDRVRALRKRLTEEEETILILRVDKKLPWCEVARVLIGTDEDVDVLRTRTSRVRKRFQLIKRKLRKWAMEDGLLRSPSRG